MFLALIRERRSIRQYTNRLVDSDKIDILIEAALRAPSSRGFDPWEFIVIDDKIILEKLSQAKPHGSAFLKGASVGIVVCANPKISDVWVEDASIASIFIQLAAQSIGLSSCWVQIRKRMHHENTTAEKYIADLLNLPASIKVESIISIGYPAEDKTPHPKETLKYYKIHRNIYG